MALQKQEQTDIPKEENPKEETKEEAGRPAVDAKDPKEKGNVPGDPSEEEMVEEETGNLKEESLDLLQPKTEFTETERIKTSPLALQTEKEEEGKETEASETEQGEKTEAQEDVQEGKYPEIETDLQSEELVTEKIKRFYVEGRDYQGNPLGESYQTVEGNGELLQAEGSLEGRAYYELMLADGENVVTITVTDSEGRKTTIESIFYYGTGKGTALFSLEAQSLGLGTYFISPVSFEEGASIKEVMLKAMEEKGYAGVCKSAGGRRRSGQEEEYLDQVLKPGITEGFRISANLREKLEEAGYEEREHRADSLGTGDFFEGSGWEISVDNEYINGMEIHEKVRKGAMIRVQFSLYYGMDIKAGEENREKDW
ncbi:hypothetical protein [Blautia sp. An249]|uniref:hypothetical protein n=1 Tax=Blautia sp. An249 TaxID=1965603 RepID=UPI001122C2F4|nr:hypothetical protein [Blautia sp. An249]